MEQSRFRLLSRSKHTAMIACRDGEVSETRHVKRKFGLFYTDTRGNVYIIPPAGKVRLTYSIDLLDD